MAGDSETDDRKFARAMEIVSEGERLQVAGDETVRETILRLSFRVAELEEINRSTLA